MKMKRYKRVTCRDEYSVSIQAGENNYCIPRDDSGPYTAVELGFPTMADPMLNGYAEDSSNLTETVYGYVPVGIVRDLIVKHGGAVMGECPPGVVMLMAEGMESIREAWEQKRLREEKEENK
tara:strand:+ start:849 stop:1214 length:366 start_codon:yes stop_codon:yes gene_type:complete